MNVLAHTKFGLVRIKGSGVKRGGGADSPPRPERVFEIPAWIGLRSLQPFLDKGKSHRSNQMFVHGFLMLFNIKFLNVKYTIITICVGSATQHAGRKNDTHAH